MNTNSDSTRRKSVLCLRAVLTTFLYLLQHTIETWSRQRAAEIATSQEESELTKPRMQPRPYLRHSLVYQCTELWSSVLMYNTSGMNTNWMRSMRTYAKSLMSGKVIKRTSPVRIRVLNRLGILRSSGALQVAKKSLIQDIGQISASYSPRIHARSSA
jgi:hypothetical protein